MLVVGLTGGIGSGKSTVATLFRDLGVPIIDTDLIAREVVQPGTDALKQIVAKFGEDVLTADGHLDRAKSREIIFKNPPYRQWLESLLHPLIREETAKQIANIKGPYCIVVIPLLAENYPHPLLDRVLVVDADEQIQLNRASTRDENSTEQIKKIVESQATRSQRLAIADDVIINNKDINHLSLQVEALHKKLLEISKL